MNQFTKCFREESNKDEKNDFSPQDARINQTKLSLETRDGEVDRQEDDRDQVFDTLSDLGLQNDVTRGSTKRRTLGLTGKLELCGITNPTPKAPIKAVKPTTSLILSNWRCSFSYMYTYIIVTVYDLPCDDE